MKTDSVLPSLFDRLAHPEPSSLVGFAGNVIESRSEEREETDLARAVEDPATRFMVARDGRLFLSARADRLEAWLDRATAELFGADLAEAVLLGRANGNAVIMASSKLPADALPGGARAIDYRSLYVEELVPPAVLGSIAQGAALMAWHATHRHCGRCGSLTEMRAGGFRRTCPSCGGNQFPRTDPVVIMLAISGERCLLGRGPHFAEGVYSCLAGFVEPGETIEAAVRRETFEESGIRIGRVAYHASQPWPFPHSLMIGCFAEALTTELNVDGRELEDCRWFSRDEVRAALAGDHATMRFPTAGAIATHLIRAWAGS